MAKFNKQRPIPETRRDGMMFVVSPEAALPCRCIKCNAECSSLQISRKISTLSPWYPLFSSAGWNSHCADDLPIHIRFSLCLPHYLERLCRLALVGFIAITNLICLVVCEISPKVGPVIDTLAFVLPLLFILTTLSLRPILRPRRVHHGLAWFAGAGPAFLQSLPELNAQPTPILETAAA
jgi:hypothetical protein